MSGERRPIPWLSWQPVSPLPYQVRTMLEHRPVTGIDSAIATVPASVWGPARVIRVQVLGRILRDASHDLAAGLGERLHHAAWTITADPAVLEEIGMHGYPQCARCRGQVDQALAHLAEHRQDLLVGVLWWAGPQG